MFALVSVIKQKDFLNNPTVSLSLSEMGLPAGGT